MLQSTKSVYVHCDLIWISHVSGVALAAGTREFFQEGRVYEIRLLDDDELKGELNSEEDLIYLPEKYMPKPDGSFRYDYESGYAKYEVTFTVCADPSAPQQKVSAVEELNDQVSDRFDFVV